MISDEVSRQIQNDLTELYPRLWNKKRGRALYKWVKDQVDDAEYKAAVRAHILGDRGHNPPLPADIMRQINNARNAAEAANTNNNSRRNEPEVELIEADFNEDDKLVKIDFKKPTTFRKVYCRECSDKGLTPFYYLRENRQIVYTKWEARELPDELFARLAITEAICDCIRGEGGTLPNGAQIEGKAKRCEKRLPRIATIRDMAARRQEKDQLKIAL